MLRCEDADDELRALFRQLEKELARCTSHTQEPLDANVYAVLLHTFEKTSPFAIPRVPDACAPGVEMQDKHHGRSGGC
ncbi:hypothetical protein OAM67_00380 [bacterium]|nr:hypothetical protein [bacterium]